MKPQEYKDQVVEVGKTGPFEQEILGMKVDETKHFSLTIPARMVIAPWPARSWPTRPT